MKGKALSQPTNHVEWANGFKSNMPDWITARHAAIGPDAVYYLKECRTLLFSVERGDLDIKDRLHTLLEGLQELIARADGLPELTAPAFPIPSGFPMPDVFLYFLIKPEIEK